MTVFDLVNAGTFCDVVEIVVREHGFGKWIQGYRISKHAEMWKCEHTVELQEKLDLSGKHHTVMQKVYGNKAPFLTDGEIRDVIHSSNLPLKIIKKDVSKIPDYIGNLQVSSYQPRHIPSFHREQLTHNEFALDINCYPEGFVPEVETEKKDDHVNQFDGQTNIFDFMEED